MNPRSYKRDCSSKEDGVSYTALVTRRMLASTNRLSSNILPRSKMLRLERLRHI